MGRHERRAEIARFRKECSGGHLMTYLVPAGTAIDHLTIKRAQAHWEANRLLRQPMCIGCKLIFADNSARVGSFLHAINPALPDSASTSAFCEECDRDLSNAQVDEICTRVLRRLLPGGVFEPRHDPAAARSAR
jgi:hypothetical protein